MSEDRVHYGPDESWAVTPQGELEEMELGWRVCAYILNGRFRQLYSDPRDQFDISVFSPWGSQHSMESPWFQGVWDENGRRLEGTWP